MIPISFAATTGKKTECVESEIKMCLAHPCPLLLQSAPAESASFPRATCWPLSPLGCHRSRMNQALAWLAKPLRWIAAHSWMHRPPKSPKNKFHHRTLSGSFLFVQHYPRPGTVRGESTGRTWVKSSITALSSTAILRTENLKRTELFTWSVCK